VLLKAMLSPKSPLENRLELIRVEPLDEPSARKLILKPLTDLGFIINQRERILEQVLSLTGRLPNLIQYLGKELAVEAIKEKSETISPEHLQKVKDNFMTAEIFIESLIGLEDPKTRLVGLCLIGSDHQNFTIQSVQEVANKENLKLDVNMVHEICNNLVIHNVLSWNNGSYTIANEGLPFYARQIGYLDGAQADARKAVKARA
jgi:hypothetical protein